ncbi:MFS general substrate transporter [Dendrothele bispora CBS 962.96]|uniref:MFS general substrate transporter n=1 Tax=Dendrothele bispora (strain CBS 962.96) TaxID=1314807 RepID=A0A4V4HEQ7_DENBC|nr:MFS general substrate transporter [Dendrothele bispora CBS 962.96]
MLDDKHDLNTANQNPTTESADGPTSGSIEKQFPDAEKGETDLTHGSGSAEDNNEGPEIPDGGARAWRCLFGAFMISVVCYGVLNSFGVFEEYYRINQLSDRSLNDISWIGSLQLCLILLTGSISGPLFDAGYFKHLILVGGLLYVFCLFMTSIATEYYQFLLAQGLGVGFSQGLLFTPSLSSLAHHFKRYRNVVFGIHAAGASVGGVVRRLPPVHIAMQRLFAQVGFGWAVRILAFIVLSCVSTGFILCSTRLPPRKNSRIVDVRVFRDIPYSFLVFGAGTVALGLYAPLSYGVTFAVDHGMSQRLAFYSLAILNACSAIGRTIPNVIAQQVGPINVLIFACTISSISLYVWITASSNAGILVFYAFFGVFSGTYVSCLSSAAVSLTKDPTETGLRLGMLYWLTSFFWLVSSPIQGALIRVHHTYWPAAVYSGTCVALGVGCMIISRQMVSRQKGSSRV